MGVALLRRRSLVLGGMAALIGSQLGLAQDTPNDSPAPLNAEGLIVVYPDYPVDTDSFYGYSTKVGHAGALLVHPTGITKYYEFGRYQPAGAVGMVRTQSISNVVIGANGKATPASLKVVLGELSSLSGKGGRIQAAYFINMDYDKMKAAALAAQPAYDITNHNCGTYAANVVTAGNANVDKPWILDPRPRNIVDEYIEEGNAEVLFDPSGAFSIGPSDESDAKT
jgi:hypothetical protein